MIVSGSKVQAHLSIDERGLAYGDGLFETIACINGELNNWPAHYLRLMDGCKRIRLRCPAENELLTHITAQLQAGEHKVTGVVKLILTRGRGGRGYRYDPEQPQTLIINWNAWPEVPLEYYHTGIESTICATRLAYQPLLAGIKHLNRLEQVLARNELSDTAYAEGITLDYDGRLVEGTSSNLFFVKNGILCTPVLENCGIKGTLRAQVLQLAGEHGLATSEGHYTPKDLRDASELFFTNSILGIYPVMKLTFSRNDSIVYASKTIMRRLSRIINTPLQRPVIK